MNPKVWITIGERVRTVAVLGVLVLSCLVWPPVIHGETGVRHLTSITSGRGFGKLEALGGVFYDEVKERVYLTGARRNRILSFDARLRFLGEFRGGEALNWPTAIVRDSRGRFFLAQPSQGEVAMVDVESRDIRKLELTSLPSIHAIYPCNLAIGPFDDLYVVDRANGRILIFDLEQRFSGEISVEGARGLTDVKVDSSGRLYVLDAVDASVHLYDRKGRRLSKFGTKGFGQGQFRFPVSLAVDQKGLIYVVDQHKEAVLVFNRRGEFLFDFSRLNQREGRLHHPSYIYINRLEKIFVIDHQNSRLSLFE